MLSDLEAAGYRGDSERQKMEEIPKPMSETFWANPENDKLQAILTIGVPDEEKAPYELSDLPMDKVHYGTY